MICGTGRSGSTGLSPKLALSGSIGRCHCLQIKLMKSLQPVIQELMFACWSRCERQSTPNARQITSSHAVKWPLVQCSSPLTRLSYR
eukprot:7816343-Karenia_brevis.AAC.1